MSLRTATRIGATAAAALAVSLTVPQIASAGFVDLRVVDGDGSTMAEYRQITGTAKIRSSRHATCFGKGNEGSGDSFKIPGKSLIGSLVDAAGHDSSLRPLLITDKFNDSLGPGICGIDGDQGRKRQYWNVKSDHAEASNLAEDPVANGADVLYQQVRFPPRDELVITGPASVNPVTPYEVSVQRYDETGAPSPAVGADVPGAAAPTDSSGNATVTSAAGVARLRARLAGTTPSNLLDVCVSADPNACGEDENLLVFGRGSDDRASGRTGNDTIATFSGRDEVDLTDGGRDVVNCGGGNDEVKVEKGDRDDDIANNCEKVIRT